jgi:hypothetical protein
MSPTSLNVNNILPIIPPSIEDEIYHSSTFVNGKFNYVESPLREIMENTWQSITIYDAWDFVKQKHERFDMSNNDILKNIYIKTKDNYTRQWSFGCIMREMQIIAQKGEKEYIKHTLLSGRYSGNQ